VVPALPVTKGKKDAKEGKDMKDWKRKLLHGESSSGDLKASSKSGSTKSQKSKVKREEFEELDYDEEFADDEEVDLGIEDKEEAKEASKRQYGRAGNKSFFGSDQSDYDEDEGDKPTSIEKVSLLLLYSWPEKLT
jgi:hypothetical protein